MRLGFSAESSFDEIIRVHIEDELGGSLSHGRDDPGGRLR